MKNPYNLWKTVKTVSTGGHSGYHCTRCGKTEYPADITERLRHRCVDSDVAYFQAWVKIHGDSWD